MDNRRYAILPNPKAYTGNSEQVYSRTLHTRQYGDVLYTDDNGADVLEFVEPLQVLEYAGNATGDLLEHVQENHYDLTNTQAIDLLQPSGEPIFA